MGDGTRGNREESVPTAWVLQSQLLPLSEQIRGHEGVGREAAEGVTLAEALLTVR